MFISFYFVNNIVFVSFDSFIYICVYIIYNLVIKKPDVFSSIPIEVISIFLVSFYLNMKNMTYL